MHQLSIVRPCAVQAMDGARAEDVTSPSEEVRTVLSDGCIPFLGVLGIHVPRSEGGRRRDRPVLVGVSRRCYEDHIISRRDKQNNREVLMEESHDTVGEMARCTRCERVPSVHRQARALESLVLMTHTHTNFAHHGARRVLSDRCDEVSHDG